MIEQQGEKLRAIVAKLALRIPKFRDQTLGEQSTKASLIDPILEALGWDIRDPDEVHREYKPTKKDCPVDYALALMREPRLFLEAKGLGESLSDRKWITQVLLYATVAGVEWCVLTDGDEYRFYNAAAPVAAEEKLFRSVRLTTQGESEVVETLNLISRSNIEKSKIDILWKAHFVDRRVKDALRTLLSSRNKALVRLIRKRAPKLSPREIVESLRRLEIRIDSPVPQIDKPLITANKLSSDDKEEKHRQAGLKAAAVRSVTLQDLLAAGVLVAPQHLFRKYKGHSFEATLQPGGEIEFQGTRYGTCSLAASYAIAVVVGKPKRTSGWQFWQTMDVKGGIRTLDKIRKSFCASKNGG